MHGLGATANDFEDVPPHLGLPADLPVRYVFPQAPSRPVTINGGWVMPAWYDITELGGWEREESFATGRGQDEAGVRASEQQIRALIARERKRGIPADKIVIAGFSQGGAVALHTALRYEENLAGVMVLSAGLLFADKLAPEAAAANRKTPLFLAHGSFDPVVSVMVGKRTRHFLENPRLRRSSGTSTRCSTTFRWRRSRTSGASSPGFCRRRDEGSAPAGPRLLAGGRRPRPRAGAAPIPDGTADGAVPAGARS